MSRRLKQGKIEEMCWRATKDVEEANAATLCSLRKGLGVAREEVVRCRKKALEEAPARTDTPGPLP